MKLTNLNSTILIGLLGVLIILYGIITSATNYTGCSNQNYSILNHFISELGQYEYSEKANIFNISLIIGTPFLIFYCLKIIPDSSKNIKVLFKWIMLTIGCSAISIGIFSMDNTYIHVVAALIFFYLCFFASLLFNAYALFINKTGIPKYFIFSGILISITTLLNIVQFHQLDLNMLTILKNRPNILFICIIEWMSFGAMLLFYISSIVFFSKKVRT